VRRARIPWRHPAGDMVSEPQIVWGRMVSRRVYTVVLLCMRLLSKGCRDQLNSAYIETHALAAMLAQEPSRSGAKAARWTGRGPGSPAAQTRTTQPHGSLVASATADAHSNTFVSLRQSALNAMALHAACSTKAGL